MKRLFYLAAGAGLGVAVVRKVSKAANKLTPSGIAGSAGESFSGLLGSMRGFVEEVRAGMVEREIELHDALVGEQPDQRRRSRHSQHSQDSRQSPNGSHR